jgi:hypothetical protein
MRAIIEPPPGPDWTPPPLWKRLAWFAAIALASVVVTGVVAYGMKALLPTY